MFATAPHVQAISTNAFNSDVATADTIGLMQQIAKQYSMHPLVHTAVHDAIANYLPKHGEQISVKDVCRAVFYWIKSHLKYNTDENIIMNGLHRNIDQYGSDLLITPDALLSMQIPEGDCDDYSMLGSSMLQAVGINNVVYCTAAANVNEPTTYSHVYCVAYLEDGSRYPLDFSHGVYPGWEYQNSSKIKEWW